MLEAVKKLLGIEERLALTPLFEAEDSSDETHAHYFVK
jgi:hypothetical protein